mmetsp:Transcript_19945/g.27889  ORF Transcript_19945/g.27889 Transcript_19945/m.27889 type:complete len:286 (-) Transcript_19945:47-904(-)
MHVPSFTARIEAEVERAYGVVTKIALSPELSFLKEQVISISDKFVATDKVVKRANKIGATRKASNYNLAVWIEVESKESREVITQCCQGKCKGKSAIAFFRTFAVLVPDSLEFEVPIIFFGAPSHNHRGKKAKFILKMQIFNGSTLIAESADCVIPYKQSSTKKRQRVKTEEESEPESSSASNSNPSSPPLPTDNNNYSLSQKRHKPYQISNLFTQSTSPYYYAYANEPLYQPNAQSSPSQEYLDELAAKSYLTLVSSQLYMNYIFSLERDHLERLLENPYDFLS